ncbi:MAG: UvrD-helicase domain-containing protein, partial [Verrucomicrobia bacterium]|nr:UvrD-helicase domain-containing protein [Verrucomicrobiota bacterium]
MDLTSAQREAIAARGNVLVNASAGTGKTRTLVERCLARVLDPAAPVPLERMLVVTFTEAAATELRLRLRQGLEQVADAHPDIRWPSEQLAALDTAAVGTLHGFCLRLVRQHFDALGLDPQLAVLERVQAELLMAATLEAIFQQHYRGTTPADAAVQELIQTYGRGRDQPIRDWVRRLHEYTQSRPDAQAWLQRGLQLCRPSLPQQWEDWLRGGIDSWLQAGRELLRRQPTENTTAQAFLDRLSPLATHWTRDQATAVLADVRALDQAWPRGHKQSRRPPLARWLEEAAFWHSLAPRSDGGDPLAEDWAWMRPHVGALLELTREFGSSYAQAKRDQGALDFHDLEQFALQLLSDSAADRPSSIAEEWRQHFQLLFVDEYQDINAAQDRILELLSRAGPQANRFLVGDVKQSIYRFRLADPRIFRRYQRAWR